jgi:hypothetical protein
VAHAAQTLGHHVLGGITLCAGAAGAIEAVEATRVGVAEWLPHACSCYFSFINSLNHSHVNCVKTNICFVYSSDMVFPEKICFSS